MSLDLSKNRDQIIGAWKDVLNAKTSTNWALFAYEAQSNALKVVGSGDGGLMELSEDLNSGKIMYAFVGVDDLKTSLTKYLLINWQGEGVPALRKGTCANHIREVQKLFTGAHLTINARTEDEVDEELIMAKLNAVGSAYSFKEPRMAHENEQRGAVGTNYSRVNPSKEISSKDRDSFWKKEEEEERHRVELERDRREKELLKQEQERRSREEKEHQERERRVAAEAVEEKFTVSNGKSFIQQPQSPIKVQSPPSPQRSFTQAEEMRQQRNKEAKELIGGRVGTAKAIFSQNSAAGQLSTVGNAGFKAAPVKPVRNSIAQRINTLNSQQEQPEIAQVQEVQQPDEHHEYSVAKMEALSPAAQETEVFIAPASPITKNGGTTNEVISTTNSVVTLNNYQIEDVHVSPQMSGHSEEEDGDQYSTIKRSPYSKNSNSQVSTPVETQPPITLPVEQAKVPSNGSFKNGNSAPLNAFNNQSIETVTTEDIIYQDIMSDQGLKARALYDYQADDESEITFDPGDVITHIDQIDEGWWQGLGPDGAYGLFPANYVELIN